MPIPRRNPDYTAAEYGELIDFVGFLRANDPVAGRNAWRHGWTIGNNTPIMATATDLLFQVGTNNGTFRALDATNGDIVWEFRTGARGNATPMTYLGPDGRQYIAYIASSAAAAASSCAAFSSAIACLLASTSARSLASSAASPAGGGALSAGLASAGAAGAGGRGSAAAA